MISGKITRYDCSYFYLMRKHFCHQCKEILRKKKREIIVNSESDEAKKYDFSVADLYLHGNIRFITYYYKCSGCGKTYEIRELKKIEKNHNKK